MIAADTPPPVISCPAPLPSRNVMVWGDHDAMESMRVAFEAKGWTWATMLLGEQTEALTLAPPVQVEDAVVCAFVRDVNGGKFGNLNAGFATFGVPEPATRESGR